MKFVMGIIVFFIVFILAEFLSINIGTMIGSGQYEIGLIVTSLSLLIATVVVCTIAIVEAIKGTKVEK